MLICARQRCAISSKTVRGTAAILLEEVKQAARPAIVAILAKVAAAERNEAALLLWRLYHEDARAVLETHSQQESERIKQSIATAPRGRFCRRALCCGFISKRQ